MNTTATANHCLRCNAPLEGRADMRFCNEDCRNSHKNIQLAADRKNMKKINGQLGKNRRLLMRILGEQEMVKVHRDDMLRLGYDFKYLTHHYTNNQGKVFDFVYEHGVLPLGDGLILVV